MLWVVGVTLAGYWLGQITFIKDHVDLILVVIVAFSLVPMAYHQLTARKGSAAG